MHAVLIENPIAGQVTPGSLRVAERALEATFELELVTTSARGHASALAREAVEAGAKTVIAFGGDGTVNEVLNGLMGAGPSTDVVLAVLPGGTTNVLARNLGFPNDLVEATARLLQLVEQGEPRRLTLGRLSADGEHGRLERDFAFAAGLVFDADIVRRVNASKRNRSDSRFIYHGLRSFSRLRGLTTPDLIVQTPAGPEDAFWACIACADPFTYFRSRPIRVAPDANKTRGLDVVASKQVRFWRTLLWLSQALTTAKHVRHRDAIYLTDLPAVTISARRPVPLQADGEYLGDITEVRAVAVPDALGVWA
ncbi:MAG: diacylglycerol/lipid kinase family protein [Actinomycetota bacterium]